MDAGAVHQHARAAIPAEQRPATHQVAASVEVLDELGMRGTEAAPVFHSRDVKPKARRTSLSEHGYCPLYGIGGGEAINISPPVTCLTLACG